MTLITLDSSVIVAYLLEEDAHHQKALLVLDQVFDGHARAMMPCSVLVEVIAAVRRRTGSETTALEVEGILRTTQGMTFLDILQPMVQGASRLAATHGLRGMDALVVQVAKACGAQLFTFDVEMASKAATILGTS